MLLSIRNECLHLNVDTLGAQMMELWSSDGIQYLWQGNTAYWGDRAPNLFPFIGRLTNNSYKYLRQVYPMGIHGFAATKEFSAIQPAPDTLVFELQSSKETKDNYPFDFSFCVVYTLKGNQVNITYHVKNLGNQTMPFGIGGHPGFNIPLTSGETFEDYEIEFSVPCCPDRIGFSPTVYMNGHDEAYPLRDERFIDLHHNLFDEDAIILKNMAREVTLRSKTTGRGVTVTYPDMPYLGIWHWPKTDAPYVCIEPWSSLPSRQDVIEEFSCKSDMIQLAPNKYYKTTWSITLL